MKKLIKKIEKSRLYFTIFMAVVFTLFLFIINDIALVSDKFNGLIHDCSILFDKLYNDTYYGKEMIGELLMVIFILPVLLLFKNKYIFTQKQDKFWPTVKKAWPLLAITITSLIVSISTISTGKFNGYELIGLIILCIFVGIFEEFMCRGWIQNEFIERFGDNRNNVIFSIIFAALFFGFMHITNVFFGNQSLTITLVQTVNAIFIGLAYGAIYYKSKNIWVPVFFHAFWDFSVMLSSINVGSTCIIPELGIEDSLFLLILGIIIITFQNIPAIWTTITFLSRKEINEELPKKGQEHLTKNDMTHENRKQKGLNVLVIAYLVFFCVVNISSAFGLIDAESFLENTGEEDGETVTCPEYIDREIYNAVEEYKTKDKEDIKVKYSVVTNCPDGSCVGSSDLSYDYRIYINNKEKLVIQDLARSISVELKFKNVKDFLVVENQGIYDISLITIDEHNNYLVYHSSFITRTNVENYPNFLNSIESTFERVLLPDIVKLGTYKELNADYTYPLYVSSINEKYILDYDGKIFKLKEEVK